LGANSLHCHFPTSLTTAVTSESWSTKVPLGKSKRCNSALSEQNTSNASGAGFAFGVTAATALGVTDSGSFDFLVFLAGVVGAKWDLEAATGDPTFEVAGEVATGEAGGIGVSLNGSNRCVSSHRTHEMVFVICGNRREDELVQLLLGGGLVTALVLALELALHGNDLECLDRTRLDVRIANKLVDIAWVLQTRSTPMSLASARCDLTPLKSRQANTAWPFLTVDLMCRLSSNKKVFSSLVSSESSASSINCSSPSSKARWITS